jgi:hypothetical protein
MLAKELECLISSLSEEIFHVEFVRTRNGEGSEIFKSKSEGVAKAEASRGMNTN